MSKKKAVLVKGDEVKEELRWEDLLEINKEIKSTMLSIVDELEKFKQELIQEGVNLEKDSKLKNIIEGVEKEIRERKEELEKIEALHSKVVEEKDENGNVVTKKVFYGGVVNQDVSGSEKDAKLFEAYLVVMNLYTNLYAKLIMAFDIGKLTALANAEIKNNGGNDESREQQ